MSNKAIYPWYDKWKPNPKIIYYFSLGNFIWCLLYFKVHTQKCMKFSLILSLIAMISKVFEKIALDIFGVCTSNENRLENQNLMYWFKDSIKIIVIFHL